MWDSYERKVINVIFATVCSMERIYIINGNTNRPDVRWSTLSAITSAVLLPFCGTGGEYNEDAAQRDLLKQDYLWTCNAYVFFNMALATYPILRIVVLTTATQCGQCAGPGKPPPPWSQKDIFQIWFGDLQCHPDVFECCYLRSIVLFHWCLEAFLCPRN